MLLCPSRLTNHPDIAGQQLPAIRSSRTHVPISRTPISSPALDPDQTPAASSELRGAARSILWARARRALLPAAGGHPARSSWALHWLGEAGEKQGTPGGASTAQQWLLPPRAGLQATKTSLWYRLRAAVWGSGDLSTAGLHKASREPLEPTEVAALSCRHGKVQGG